MLRLIAELHRSLGYFGEFGLHIDLTLGFVRSRVCAPGLCLAAWREPVQTVAAATLGNGADGASESTAEVFTKHLQSGA